MKTLGEIPCASRAWAAALPKSSTNCDASATRKSGQRSRLGSGAPAAARTRTGPSAYQAFAEPRQGALEADVPLEMLEQVADAASPRPRRAAPRSGAAGRASARTRAASRSRSRSRSRTRPCRRGRTRRPVRPAAAGSRPGRRRRGMQRAPQRRGRRRRSRDWPTLRGRRGAQSAGPSGPRSGPRLPGRSRPLCSSTWISERLIVRVHSNEGFGDLAVPSPLRGIVAGACARTLRARRHTRERARQWDLRARSRAFGGCW